MKSSGYKICWQYHDNTTCIAQNADGSILHLPNRLKAHKLLFFCYSYLIYLLYLRCAHSFLYIF